MSMIGDSKLPPLYNRVHQYDKWYAKNETNDQVKNPEDLNPQAAAGANLAKQGNRANIEVDPEDPEYLNDDDEFNGFHHRDSSDDDDNDDMMMM